jgi:hypothetical protein
MEGQIAARDATLERLRSDLEAERRKKTRTKKLRHLRKLAAECKDLEAKKTLAAEKAEAALAEYVGVAVSATDTQNALREHFTVETSGENAELSAALADGGTDTRAISGISQARQTPYAQLLEAAVAKVWQARFREKQEAERVARDERRREAERERARRAEEARLAEVEEEQRQAERRAEREREEREQRRAMLEAAGFRVTTGG